MSDASDREARRMDAVRRYDILDSPPDGAFDRLTALTARVCNTPAAVVTIVDSDRIWFKSHHGLDVDQIGRDPGLCASAILQEQPWIVEDASVDPRTLANPLVSGEVGLRFYLGVPLTTSDGHNLGTLCALDFEPREATDREIADITDLAAVVVDELELRLAARRVVAAEQAQHQRAEEIARLVQDGLLPRTLPMVDGVELGAQYLPANLERVGGDFYEAGVMSFLTAPSHTSPRLPTKTKGFLGIQCIRIGCGGVVHAPSGRYPWARSISLQEEMEMSLPLFKRPPSRGSTLDESALSELIVESQDLQSDAMRDAKATLPMVEAMREERRNEPAAPVDIAAFLSNRRSVLRKIGIGSGMVLGASGLGATLLGILAPTAAAADTSIDIQMLQTASSLERLAVATYGAALTLPFIKDGNKVVVAFAQTTMMQHDEHKKAFQARTKALGGTEQDTPNPKYAPIVEAAKPTLKTPLDVVKLAATLEQVARDTYLADLAMFTEKESLTLVATVMGVETQHLATLRAVGALLAGGAPQLIAIPTDVAKLPAAAGSVGFDAADYKPTMASPPAEGAIK